MEIVKMIIKNVQQPNNKYVDVEINDEFILSQNVISNNGKYVDRTIELTDEGIAQWEEQAIFGIFPHGNEALAAKRFGNLTDRKTRKMIDERNRRKRTI